MTWTRSDEKKYREVHEILMSFDLSQNPSTLMKLAEYSKWIQQQVFVSRMDQKEVRHPITTATKGQNHNGKTEC